MQSLDLEAVKHMLTVAADRVIAARDVLTHADQAIGDGDHGVAMERGFTAARKAIAEKPANTVGDVFKNAGMAILGAGGGASGAVFGTLFIGAAKPLTATSLDAAGFAEALAAGLSAVEARGKAKPGDKTMLEALAPAVAAARKRPGEDMAAVRAAAAKAARAQAVHAEVTAFVDAGIAAGTFLPAWRDAGIPAVLEQTLVSEAEVAFAAGQPPKKAGEILLGLFKSLPKIVPLGEHAPGQTTDPEAALKAEFAAGKAVHEQMGVTFETWKKNRIAK